ncbi:hypothetical protein [Rhodococcus pyridinivorans]|uniref:hypothetical protein n=1 Tax=Rhodococcus pyridinivorans TaxID=103816 RepID=UPI0020784C94|nr:hypothetical protein [Rhodococcus pyridinivorans]USI93020.1 hypothetical protein LLA01_24245 [Rhodococcus pyridinivorans]
MSLYTVSYLGQDQWLAYEDTQAARIYAYVPNLGRFVLHRQLGQDFYWDNELDWTPVDAATGHALVEAGQLGKLDGRRHRDLLDELTAEPDRRSVDEVFGAQPVPERTPSPQEFAAAKVHALAAAAPGKWLTYKVYDRDKRKAASVAARDLRTGKIAAVRKSGLHIDSRVTSTVDGRFAVEIARTA